MDRDYPPNPSVDMLMIVVAEMYAAGYFERQNIDNIAHKLELSEHADLADRVRTLPFQVLLSFDPEA